MLQIQVRPMRSLHSLVQRAIAWRFRVNRNSHKSLDLFVEGHWQNVAAADVDDLSRELADLRIRQYATVFENQKDPVAAG